MENSSWVTYNIADLIDQGSLIIGDGYRAKNEELGTSGFPFLRARNIKNGVQLDEADYLSQEGILRVGEKVSYPGDVVFTSSGNMDRFTFIQDSTSQVAYSSQLCYWRITNRHIIDPHFLYYWMSSHEFWTQYNAFKDQANRAEYVRLSDQRRMHITLPPLKEQSTIAYVLSTIDDKIELNRCMNETLETMIQELFKSWFLDFDLVHANVEEQQLEGVDRDTANLFPNEFKESLLGNIPQGWQVASVGDVVRIIGGSTPSKQEPLYWEGGTIHWVTSNDLASLSSSVLLDAQQYITEFGLQQISSGLLPIGTVLLSSRATLSYMALTEIPVAINQSLIGLICNGELPNHYILQWARANRETIKNCANGTIFPEISKASFRLIPIAIPPQSILERFVSIATAIHQQIVNNLEQSHTLVALRDELLAKFFSGKMRIR